MTKKTFLMHYLLPALYMAVPSLGNIVYDSLHGHWASFMNLLCALFILLAVTMVWWRNAIFNRVLGILFALPVNYLLLAIVSDFRKSTAPASYIPAFTVWTITCCMYVLLLATPSRKSSYTTALS